MDKERELAIDIIDLFEELLDKYDITIPCEEYEQEDRDNNDGAARIYGERYFDLEDEITELLKGEM